MPDAWIRRWSDPVLRMPAAPVRVVDRALREQAVRMEEQLLAADGAGLAATQVGVLRRLFVFRTGVDEPVRALVNPVVVAASAELADFAEGCLSFHEVTVTVARPVAVRVEGHDLDGRPVVLDAEGPDASLLQHETDHLDGILTLDRATPAERRRVVAALSYGRTALAA